MTLSLTGRVVGYILTLIVPSIIGGAAARHASARTAVTDGTAARRDTSALRVLESRAVSDITDSLRGRSGKLFMRLISPDRASSVARAFAQWFGGSAPQRPGVYRVADSILARPFAVITLHPFTSKRADRIGGYRLGFWPAERRRMTPTAYANPTGFIEVTSDDDATTPVSEHFRLGDFLTHDQAHIWPKYLVLREDLIDKLELVIAELERSGVSVRTMRVMSGFRTPQYNAKGGNTAGRAELSRHMYGDAADVFVDNDGDGRMDDLNRDGRVDSRDAKVIVAASEKVERAHSDLVGGAGVYRATSAHGPFAHIDVRGKRARWGRM
jgi:hypothetical protein